MEMPVRPVGCAFHHRRPTPLDTIPRPLLDRMEVIELSSYTDEEKLQIAKQHLLPKQRKKHGLKPSAAARERRCHPRDHHALYARIRRARARARACRASAARRPSASRTASARACSCAQAAWPTARRPRASSRSSVYAQDEVGLVRGLAWTSVGGEVLDVEAAVLDGTGKLELTGNLGDVMKESAQAARHLYPQPRADSSASTRSFTRKRTCTSISRRAPSRRTARRPASRSASAVISALTDTPVRRDLAMTGEITLRGRILPIGGLKEKTMAAMRIGITTVIIPARERKGSRGDRPDRAQRAQVRHDRPRG